VFFFQAERGIRAGQVTGVQTCALPICRLAEAHLEAHQDPSRFRLSCSATRVSHASLLTPATAAKASSSGSESPRSNSASASATRSEERRVGKECRYRWSADQ